MDALGPHSYDSLVKLERESYYDQAFIQQLPRDATTLLHTTLDWHLLEVITSSWNPFLRCITIGDFVPSLEEYDYFLSLSTPLRTIFVPLVRPRYRKRLTDLLHLKRPVVEALTWYGNGIGGSMSFNFLYDQFHPLECPVGY